MLHRNESSEAIRVNSPTVLAFLTIYIVWGSTFVAIRIAVEQIPFLFAAGVRFFTAGLILYAYAHLRGLKPPNLREWRNIVLLSVLIFVVDYSALFWAERYVPSGIASVLAATIPLITMALEVFILRRQQFQWSLLLAILLGFSGVGVLMLQGPHQQFPILPCLAILVGSTAWAIGTVLTRSLRLPQSKMITAGAEMLVGGAILLVLSASSGELHPFPHVSLSVAMALLYLIVFGSVLGFTAYMWLLGRMPATRVASYAYVNPVVAVVLGYFIAHEGITLQMVIGIALVLTSVVLTLQRKPAVRT